MSFIDRDLLNRLLILSAAITEMIELETQVVTEFRDSNYQFAGRKEYLSFWLRTQSFFVSAQSLTDSEQFRSCYLSNTEKHWRLGVKALRHFFAHEVNLIPSLHTSVHFIPEERVSISLQGFVINAVDANLILESCVRNAWRRELRQKQKDGCLPLSKVRKIYQKHLNEQLRALNEWKSKPNQDVVVISDIATRHYLIVYDLLDVLRANDTGDGAEIAEETVEYDSGVIPLKDKVRSIEETVTQVKAYRANNYRWNA